MIDTFNINKEQEQKILETLEWHFFDIKRKEIKPNKLVRSVSAFANSDWWEIIVWVWEGNEKSRFFSWFHDLEDANWHIQAIEESFPFSNCLDISFLRLDSDWSYLLKININKSREFLNASDWYPYIRKWAQNIPIKDEAWIKKLEFKKWITSFEQNTLNLPENYLLESDVIDAFIQEVIPTSSPKKWLHKQLLLIDNKPTVAGVLLFGDEPQAALPKQSGVKIFRYTTTEQEWTRANLAFTPITIEGHIYKQIEESIKTTVELVQKIQILWESWLKFTSYPTETIHEIITNAILHRDYSVPVDIKIIIFDNRIEVHSPWRLPWDITPENILEEQFARNWTLVRITNKFPNPPNKDVWEWLNTAFSAMKKLRLKEPIISQNDNGVLVIIKHESLSSPESIVMDYLINHAEISNSIARGLCWISSENQMKGIFQRLQKSKLLERTPWKLSTASTWRKLWNIEDESEQKSLF